MVATQENGGVGGRRKEPNAATQPQTDHRRTGFERWPSPCLSGSSPVTNRELQRNLSNAQSENLPPALILLGLKVIPVSPFAHPLGGFSSTAACAMHWDFLEK